MQGVKGELEKVIKKKLRDTEIEQDESEALMTNPVEDGDEDIEAARPPAKPAPERNTTKEALALLAAVFIGVWFQLVQKLSQRGTSSYAFSTFAVLALAELGKFTLSFFMLYCSSDTTDLRTYRISFREFFTWSILAAAYCFNNQMTFLLLTWMGPGQFTLGKSLAPVMTTLLLWIGFNELPSKPQAISLAIACISLINVFYKPDKPFSGQAVALFCLLLTTAVSAINSILNSKALQNDQLPLLVRNMLLYSQGFIVNLVMYLLMDGSLGDLFKGFDIWAIAVLFAHSVNGLAVAFILKHGGAVIKALSACLISSVLVMTDFMFFGIPPFIVNISAAIVVILGGYLYMNSPKGAKGKSGPISAIGRLVGGTVVGLFFVIGGFTLLV